MSAPERYAALFKPTNIWAEDEGLERSARRVGTSVLVKASEFPGADRSKRMYALVVMIVLIEASESRRVQKGPLK